MMILNDDQRMLQDTVRPFMAEEGAIKRQLRHWREIGCKDGFGHGLWKQFGGRHRIGVIHVYRRPPRPPACGAGGMRNPRYSRQSPPAAEI
jgi:hypothetical protein